MAWALIRAGRPGTLRRGEMKDEKQIKMTPTEFVARMRALAKAGPGSCNFDDCPLFRVCSGFSTCRAIADITDAAGVRDG